MKTNSPMTSKRRKQNDPQSPQFPKVDHGYDVADPMNEPSLQTVTLDRLSWRQLLDGLACRAEQYEETARFHLTGQAEGEILEVRDAEEAQAIASDYRQIISKIEAQLEP